MKPCAAAETVDRRPGIAVLLMLAAVGALYLLCVLFAPGLAFAILAVVVVTGFATRAQQPHHAPGRGA